VVLHGGPGVPSDYLLPLKTLAAREQRKMFFYDQLVRIRAGAMVRDKRIWKEDRDCKIVKQIGDI
jgi:hypothetical protein